MKKLLLAITLVLGVNTSWAGIDTPITENIEIKFTGENLSAQQGRHFQVWLKRGGYMTPVIRLNINAEGEFYRASKNGGHRIATYLSTDLVSTAVVTKGRIDNLINKSILFVTLEPDNDFRLGGEFDASTVIMSGGIKLVRDGYSSRRYVAEPVWSPIVDEFIGAEFHLLIN